ncbi:uncharacterized protein LOC132198556 [Neocloeon triangulifer]|uniref:uncharacterized protein LOC132198556 n=1 Tax=Neocloeon triangulifer TaxID=2078957 RepID=UPI00286ED975|nr:uncharacterized protein LOC132198556 [Neocloeon triangulifer]XP_059478616.1 uncharacterized protein LOC132198556 [Neocloeon triangulifer]
MDEANKFNHLYTFSFITKHNAQFFDRVAHINDVPREHRFLHSFCQKKAVPTPTIANIREVVENCGMLDDSQDELIWSLRLRRQFNSRMSQCFLYAIALKQLSDNPNEERLPIFYHYNLLFSLAYEFYKRVEAGDWEVEPTTSQSQSHDDSIADQDEPEPKRAWLLPANRYPAGTSNALV